MLNDKSQLVFILEELGCHKINPYFAKNELRAALPDGETATSISIKLETYLPCHVFSRGDYDDYEVKDIFTLIQFIKGINFFESLTWACEKLNVENDENQTNTETLNIVKELRKEKRRSIRTDNEIKHEVLDKRILKKYVSCVVKKWVEEGISPEIQKKYGILNDEIGKRWLIPIYDELGNLVSIKGRTYSPNWEEMGIPKFLYYFKIGVNDILFGLNFNKQAILERDEIILYEAEKSVMASDSYGYNWSANLGKNGINPHIKRKILSLHISNCVLGFDNDVPIEKAIKEAKKLSKYMNVYIMKSNGRLKEKQSPTDAGKETLDNLYNTKIRIH